MLNKGNNFIFMRMVGAVVLCLVALPLSARPQSTQGAPSTEQILEYTRELLAFPETTMLTAGPIHASQFPGYYEATITAGAGVHAKTWNVALSTNRDFLIVGKLFDAGSDFQSIAATDVRQVFDLPSDMEVSVGQPRDSIYSDFYKASVEIRKDTQQQSTDIFLTRDRHTLVVGMVFPIEARPRPEILNSISLADAATQGPNDAPITILEYADLQCPACARMHEFLENELIPKYEGKVRILFKEFPLVSIHNWAWTGAISNKCVSELAPKRFVAYQSSVFQRQTDITPANVRSSLLQIATTVGIDTSKLSSCIDNQTPKSLIEEDIREGKLLEISTTPTFVVNGRIVAGMPEKSYFYKIIDDALARNMADGGLATHASCACDREFGIRASAPPAGVVRPKQ